jgi:hypothetical protein
MLHAHSGGCTRLVAKKQQPKWRVTGGGEKSPNSPI